MSRNENISIGPSHHAMNKIRKKTSFRRWESPLAGYLFISPWLLGFLGLTLYPMMLSLYYSFTDYTLMQGMNWVGLGNYKRILLEDDKFVQSLAVTFKFVIVSVPVRLLAALLVALALNQAVKGLSAYRVAIYFPSLIGGSIAVSMLWGNIFGIDGFVNRILQLFGFKGRGWISDPDTALWTLVLLTAWQLGSAMVIFLAGLKQIPRDLYEASSADGASRLKQTWCITLPMLTPTLYFNLIMAIIGAFQMFTAAYVITRGGPMNATMVYAVYLYERAFNRYQMGYASSLAWMMLMMIAVVAGIIALTSKYWVFYETESGGGRP
ncbi:ABC transporter permease [Paenibacillus sp. MY03]|jgi:multiple sugar transport system permease protein|uniref:carbohydrate ABC transporter permease n=1 Tax=Paenibacillus sp. MY03 TaxID=302980 RepID=UPI000B3C009B|nr:sugar ABC transporter permease [Paenibacillus sp. MY03]OUS76634.1 ABC transporter permease [Paenibacillus sp. MY03]